MKNILISGGAGFIGSHLALHLKNIGYNVTVLDNLSPQIHGEDPEKDSFLYQKISIHPNGPLEIKPWGQKEFSLLDPDGNLLTFGQRI